MAEQIRNLYYQSKTGYITGKMDSDGYFLVYKFVIYPQYRGKGYAKELARHLPQKAKLLAAPLHNRDSGPVLDIDNLIKFYQSLGFALKPDQYNNNMMFRESYEFSFKHYILKNFIKL